MNDVQILLFVIAHLHACMPLIMGRMPMIKPDDTQNFSAT